MLCAFQVFDKLGNPQCSIHGNYMKEIFLCPESSWISKKKYGQSKCIWKCPDKPQDYEQQYCFSSFAITLNGTRNKTLFCDALTHVSYGVMPLLVDILLIWCFYTKAMLIKWFLILKSRFYFIWYLTELTPKLRDSLPPTDSRFRPDQRALVSIFLTCMLL